MDITSLSAFVEVARTGSFSVAADHLFLSQPAISRRVAGLEAELGAALFDRIGRRISLTEAGHALLPQAERLLNEAAELKRVVSSLSDEVAGDLIMGTSHHVGLHRLPPALRAYNQAYPQVQLDIRFMDSETACRAVATGELELAVVTLPTTPDTVLRTERLWQDDLVFAVNRDHPLAGRQRVPLKTLAEHRAVLPGQATYTRAILETAVRETGVDLQVAMSTNYLETLKMLVATGLGWSLLPATMLDDEVCALNTGLHLTRELGLVTHTKRTLSNAARAMIDTCRAQAARQP